MLLYIPAMANTKSAKKNIKSSAKKRQHNNVWKKKFRTLIKSLTKSISGKDSESVVTEKFRALQKSLDKASKEKVIHKNRANRVKSRYAKKLSAHVLEKSGKTDKEGPESETKSGLNTRPKRKSKDK